ncbi:MAG: T9SS type A sorting domain-containing protein [Flavobacteriaceae bacterium]|nr:T9SS type A sorting domain-containing protein [Flavobacteriaceae bacterium]
MKKNYFFAILCFFALSNMMGQVEILNETLRSGTIPTGWTQINTIFETGAGGYAKLNGIDAELITPTIDLSGFINVNIQLNVAKFGTGGEGPITVLVSNDDGVTWNTQSFDTPIPTSSTYLSLSPTLINTSSSTTKIKFTTTNSPSVKRLRDVIITGEIITGTPLLTTFPDNISNLDYVIGNGPSAAQTFVLSGANLDGSDVILAAPANFEISLDNSAFADNLVLNAFDGQSTTIWVRLKAGLPVATYNDALNITGGGANSISLALDGNVSPPATQGWQITATDQAFTIDFDNSVAGVNAGQFSGSGIVSAPSTGQLDSNGWATTGMSDGVSGFGDNNPSGDFANGSSLGVVTSGGFYAFETSTGNFSFGIQPGGSDFTPGSITLRTQNQSGAPINEIDLAYLVHIYNDQDRANSFNFAYSTDNTSFTAIPELNITSDEAAMSNPAWESYYRNIRIDGLNIADGDFLYLRWESNDVSGNNSRDEFALDDIQLIANPSSTGLSIAGDFRAIVLGTNTQVTNAASVSGTLQLLDNTSFTTNDAFTFKSTAERNGVLATMPTSASINGAVTTERFFTARRAFRFVSPAVTSTGTISENWQENGANNADLGTHITGNGGATNGFDPTSTNNPSLFTFNNLTQTWEAVTNTNTNTLSAGTAYRLFVRGDRTVLLTDNNATPSETRIRTTGTLVTGDFSVTNLSDTVDEFNFVGNPYQAVVNMGQVISDAANVKTDFFVWDPSLNARGAYVTVDSTDGSNISGSTASNELQPGQSIFLENAATAATSVSFKESHKIGTSAAALNLFNSAASGKITISLHADSNSPAMDATQFKFSAVYDSNSSADDAGKIINPDETIATNNNGSLHSIERRNYPAQTDTLSLFTDRYRQNNYVLRIDATQLDNSYTYSLHDRFTQQTMPISNTSFDYAFSVNDNQALSVATDRFEVIVSNQTLSFGDLDLNNSIRLFPNPTSNGQINLSLPTNATNVQLNLFNMTGQYIFGETYDKPNGIISLSDLNLNAGLYHLVLQINQQKIVKKLIVK